MNSSVCVDANLLVRALVPGPLTENALSLMEQWRDEETIMVAPALLAFEVTSTLRRMVFLQEITDEEGDEVFQKFQQIRLRLSHRKEIFPLAWKLAQEYNRPRAYDTTYLALAQLYECDFWTADERLFNAVGARLPWVRWLGAV